MLEKGTTFPVLHGQGFVRYVRHMGGDEDVIEAARLTAQSEGKSFADDRTLLRYLMRHRHSTPYEFCELVVHYRVPMDLWRQAIRHRTANVNEYSTRYSEAIDEKATTPPDKWRKQATTNRQGSSSEFVTEFPENFVTAQDDRDFRTFDSAGEYLAAREEQLHNLAADVYHERLRFGVAKEQARKDLPLSTFTEAYWKIDLHNLLHFLGLRMDAHAQQEIREVATVLGEQIVAKLFPVTWEAFLDYRLNAMTLTALDIRVVQEIQWSKVTLTKPAALQALATRIGLEGWDKDRCRERDECWSKLVRLGLAREDS